MKTKIITCLSRHAHKETADGKYNYMKRQFLFYGIPAPLRMQVIKPILEELKVFTVSELTDLIYSLASEPQRECFYTAIDIILDNYNRFTYQEIQALYPLITTKPWWDSVDKLHKPLSLWALKHYNHRQEIAYAWNQGSSIWLKRSALILQLHWKERTDSELLFALIKDNKENSEFFIQKAIGWALREFSKTNPQMVREFLSACHLSKLSVREASKYLHLI